MKRFKHVAIEGCIGAGKTTVGKLVAQRIGANFIGEDAERNSFLSKFYADPPRYAFETELSFLLIHFHQLRHRENSELVVTDFTLGKDRVFAQMNLAARDMKCFEQLFVELNERLAPPEVVVFLRADPVLCLDRIRARAIPCEQNISVEYLAALEVEYLRNLEGIGGSAHVLQVDRDHTIDEVAEAVCALVAA
jgi:deoxyguanosine kinase